MVIEAEGRAEAEQLVSDNWNKCQYILGAGDFFGVEFTVYENNFDDVIKHDGKETKI